MRKDYICYHPRRLKGMDYLNSCYMLNNWLKLHNICGSSRHWIASLFIDYFIFTELAIKNSSSASSWRKTLTEIQLSCFSLIIELNVLVNEKHFRLFINSLVFSLTDLNIFIKIWTEFKTFHIQVVSNVDNFLASVAVKRQCQIDVDNIVSIYGVVFFCVFLHY